MKTSALPIAEVQFPPSANVSVNMMPFIMGDHNSLPPNLRRYCDLIDACQVEQIGKVGYLTVTESTVASNTSQRRGGIHTESPGRLSFVTGVAAWGGWGGGQPQEDPLPPPTRPNPKPRPRPNGCGHNRFGGIYMASTVPNSCRLWDNVHVEQPGRMGDCEHLRDSLGQGVLMQKGELWWLTDRCPHESLPIPAGTHRQFFRLVTNQVSVWFSKHSTPNPLGVLPDCQIVDVDKFAIA